MFKTGDAVITDYGSAIAANTREGEEGAEIGIVVDNLLVWIPADSAEAA
jgi:hypothetical protein